jgi:hypothetical protein
VSDCRCKTLSASNITRGSELPAPSSASFATPIKYLRTSAKSKVLTLTYSIFGGGISYRLHDVHANGS